MRTFIRYKHRFPEGTIEMWVDEELKGLHRDHCLCWSCAKFKPGENRDDNCPIANILFRLNKLANIVTPVWECKEFEQVEVDDEGNAKEV